MKALLPKSKEVTKSQALTWPAEGFLLAVTFTKSRSKNYPLAVSMAKAGQQYREEDIDGTLVHGAGFARDRRGALQAIALLKIVGGWRGAQVFAGAKGTTSAFNALEVLTCFVAAGSMGDPQKHCHVYFGGAHHPCRLLEAHSRRGVSIEASAIYRGVDWCPFLNWR